MQAGEVGCGAEALSLWAPRFGQADRSDFDALYDESGCVRPDRFDALLESEGIDVGILLCEYSPKVTGIQPVNGFWDSDHAGLFSALRFTH